MQFWESGANRTVQLYNCKVVMIIQSGMAYEKMHEQYMPLLKNNGSHLNHQPDLQKFPSLALAPAIAHNGFSWELQDLQMPKDAKGFSAKI